MKRLLLLTAALLLSGAALAQEGYERQRRDLFDVLPVRSNDIIFLGDGLTDGCEWAELFDNTHPSPGARAGRRAGGGPPLPTPATSRTAASAATVRNGCSSGSTRSSRAIRRSSS